MKTFLASMLCLTMLGMAFADSGFNFLKGAKAGSFEYFFYNDDGEKEWKLTGERPIFLENDDIRIENPILLLYSKDKKEHHSKIKADISILKGEKKLCSMQGNVIAKNAEGFSFSSALAKCDMKKKEITFPKKFKVLMNEIKMVGADGVLYMNKKLMMSKGKSKLEYTHVEKTK